MKRLYPLKAIKKYCIWCYNGQREQVKLCGDKDCPLYPLRLGKRRLGYSVLKAIRKRCLDCMGNSTKDVKNCQFKDCPLYEFRLGHNPALKGRRGKRGYNVPL